MEADQFWQPLIDPLKVVQGVLHSKMLILAMTALGALIGIGIALSTPKKYEAVAEMIVDPRNLQIVGNDLTQQGLPSDATLAIVENQVRVLTSGTVLNKVVDRLGLDRDPEFNGQDGGFSLRGAVRSLFSRGSAADEGRAKALAVRNLAESLHVERSGRTFVVMVGATTRDPEKSALIANTVTDEFLKTSGELQSDTAARATDELTGRLDELQAGVEEAERKVETFKAENDLVDAQGRLITDDEIIRLNDQLAQARARTIELNARAASAKGADLNAAVAGTLPEQVSSAVMTELRSQYAALRQEVDRLGIRLGPRHPDRLAAEAQLSGLREQIAAELRRIVSSIEIDLRRAVQQEQDLAARLAQMKVRQGDVSGDLVTLRELEREAAAKRAVYEAFLLRARETGEQKDLNTANMSVISRAFPPLEPLGPSRSMIALTGMFLGFLGGIALGAARGAYWSFRDNADGAGRYGPPDDVPPGGRPGRSGGHPDLPPIPPAPRRYEASWRSDSPEAGRGSRLTSWFRRPLSGDQARSGNRAGGMEASWTDRSIRPAEWHPLSQPAASPAAAFGQPAFRTPDSSFYHSSLPPQPWPPAPQYGYAQPWPMVAQPVLAGAVPPVTVPQQHGPAVQADIENIRRNVSGLRSAVIDLSVRKARARRA